MRRRPGLLPGPRLPRHVRPRVPRGPARRGPARRVPPGEVARRPAACRRTRTRASCRDFWQFPTVSMGIGPINAIYQAQQAKYLHQPRHQGRLRPAGLGVPRRRRDGRGRVPRPAAGRGERRPRQPELRHQLQPAAPRRSGPRQRQDHPGARGVLPRCRLERHQGRLGPRVGRPARPRHRGRAAQPDEPDAGRRLPDVQGRERRLRPRELLRARPAGARSSSRTTPTTRSGTSSAAATTTARSTPRSRPRPSTRASRPSSSRRRSRATASARASRAATRPTR